MMDIFYPINQSNPEKNYFVLSGMPHAADSQKTDYSYAISYL
jgi:hypothetical protein